MRICQLLTASAAYLLVPGISAIAQSDSTPSWPDYRGPRHDGRSDATGLPVRWSESENVAWKTAIHGRGWSSPVVADGEIWLTSATEDGRELFVLCVDAESGRIVLDKKLFNVDEPQFAHPFNSYASPSPVMAGAHVYVSFGSPGTACLDRQSKQVVWTRVDLVCNHFRGAGSSPFVFRDLLILTMDGSDEQDPIALERSSGKTRWREDRSTDFQDIDPVTGGPKGDGDFRKGFSTPIVIEVGGQHQLISPGAKAAFAYDPETGEELWSVRHTGHSSASRSLFGHGLVFFNTGYSQPELVAVRPTGRGDVTATHVAWRLRRRVPKKPSPLLIGDFLYMVSDGGVASCVEAKTGETAWYERIGGEYSASLLYAGGSVYACSEEGKTVVFRPGSKFERIAENRLEGGFMASPAVSGGSLILRTKTHLYRVKTSIAAKR